MARTTASGSEVRGIWHAGVAPLESRSVESWKTHAQARKRKEAPRAAWFHHTRQLVVPMEAGGEVSEDFRFRGYPRSSRSYVIVGSFSIVRSSRMKGHSRIQGCRGFRKYFFVRIWERVVARRISERVFGSVIS